MTCLHLLPVCALSFYSLNNVIQGANVLNFDKVQVMNFFINCTFGVVYKTSLLDPRLQRFSTVFI